MRQWGDRGYAAPAAWPGRSRAPEIAYTHRMSAAGYVTDIAYVPGFYPQMAPVSLRHVAALNGVVPPATASGFRYLELGCGLGRSFTTLAGGRSRHRRRRPRQRPGDHR